MSIQEGINNILENKLEEMRQNFVTSLQEKVVTKLDERKQEIAKNYFGQK